MAIGVHNFSPAVKNGLALFVLQTLLGLQGGTLLLHG